MSNSDVITIMGSDMAECHPVAFRWVMKAKEKGATLIHIDPRFTRTSAVADIYAPIRAGSDIVFLGGLISWVINTERYFKEYVLNYTNAATIVGDQFQDTEDLEGLFSGYNPQTRTYENRSWQYDRTQVRGPLEGTSDAQRGSQPQTPQPAFGFDAAMQADTSQNFDALVKALVPPRERRDETLQDPRCVFQILKHHYERYTPEMVERVTGCPQELFLKIAQTMADNSGPERTGSMAYAVAWTQHTIGVQIIRAAGILQQLLGNIGRPGGGILALRGHASIQGSTDNPTLYHSITGYMSAPSILKRHETLKEYLATETVPTSYYSNQPKFMVSYLKAMYGNTATKDNDYGYAWHPRISGDHSHIPMMVNMADGKVKGMFAIGQNPAVGGQNAGLQRRALANLEWLVVRDYFETETAAFWRDASPEVSSGQLKTADIQTEIFFLPAAHNAEGEGSFTNTHRLLQWHEKAADPPGDARTDLWFTYHLGKLLKQRYQGSALPRDQGLLNLTWDYEPDPTETVEWRIKDEPSARTVLKEINGYETATGKLLAGFGAYRDDGGTVGGNWIYSGVYPAEGRNLAASRTPDNYVSLGWGFNWPANRHIMYNRASARPDGQPWSDRKRYVWWDPQGGADQKGLWVGYDVPDYVLNKAPATPADDNGVGVNWQSGVDPFIMHADGKAWLYAPTGLVDGPLPTHYEPAESPVGNALYPKQQNSPVFIYFNRPDNQLAEVGDPKYPYALTTYRLTEHYLSGTMSRWLPWLAELQPELFIEMSPELAREKGIKNLDMVTISTPRASIQAQALVTGRLRPFRIDDGRGTMRTVHQVGMPWHWGYQGVAKGAIVNSLSSLVMDPNVSMHEGK
ncbi:MAG: molybdopterin-dependent oxidoreductase, partial [Chloroflexota bacterium]|nr:molybdopterin-dependent oxidoreductase [Chloroflexota bacterium]